MIDASRCRDAFVAVMVISRREEVDEYRSVYAVFYHHRFTVILVMLVMRILWKFRQKVIVRVTDNETLQNGSVSWLEHCFVAARIKFPSLYTCRRSYVSSAASQTIARCC